MADKQQPELRLQERRLRKVKVNKDGGLTVEYEEVYYDDVALATTTVKEVKTSDAPAHEDLLERFKPFTEHLMLVCEMIREPKGRPPFDGSLNSTNQYVVGSITTRGGEDEKPVQVFTFGRKKLKSGHVTNFGTYGVKLNHAAEPYKWADDMEKHLDGLTEEVWAYVFEGKRAADPQTSILDPDQTDGDGEEPDA